MSILRDDVTMLQINNLSKVYNGRGRSVRALDDVTLTIKQGEILALLGVNGAGKTTLSSILATLHPPTLGAVLYRGVSIYDTLEGYRRILGFCPQHPNLDTYLTVEENLVFAGRYFLMKRDEAVSRALGLLERFSLKKYASFNVNALSGGYKQRLLIARAMMHGPRMVILDEPTVGLDPGIRRSLWEVIADLRKDGVTVLLTTHYLEEAEFLADRVCILSKGKIILTDTVDALKSAHQKSSLEEVFLHLTREDDDYLG